VEYLTKILQLSKKFRSVVMGWEPKCGIALSDFTGRGEDMKQKPIYD